MSFYASFVFCNCLLTMWFITNNNVYFVYFCRLFLSRSIRQYQTLLPLAIILIEMFCLYSLFCFYFHLIIDTVFVIFFFFLLATMLSKKGIILFSFAGFPWVVYRWSSLVPPAASKQPHAPRKRRRHKPPLPHEHWFRPHPTWSLPPHPSGVCLSPWGIAHVTDGSGAGRVRGVCVPYDPTHGAWGTGE